MEDRVRIRSEEILPDDWAILKRPSWTTGVATASGRRKYAKPMIAAMAR